MTANPIEPAQPSVAEIPPCPQHARLGQWLCGGCGQPLCPECQPIAYQNKVYHPVCLHHRREQIDKPGKKAVSDGPSTGVNVIAWIYISLSVILVGLALIMLGLVLFSHQSVPMGAWLGGASAGLDDIPGGRTLVTWASVSLLIVAAGLFFLGIGLLNTSQAARRIILLFSWLEVLVAAFAWLVVAALGKGFWDIPIPAMFLIWFFSRKSIRQQFSKNT
jgi:hypothetical protein